MGCLSPRFASSPQLSRQQDDESSLVHSHFIRLTQHNSGSSTLPSPTSMDRPRYRARRGLRTCCAAETGRNGRACKPARKNDAPSLESRVALAPALSPSRPRPGAVVLSPHSLLSPFRRPLASRKTFRRAIAA